MQEAIPFIFPSYSTVIFAFAVGKLSWSMSIFLYACETWIVTADVERWIQALEMRCFLKLLGISYRDHITNEEVKARI